MPVVVVSGYVAEAYQSAEPLADLYLEKPVNPEELVTIVERAAEGERTRRVRLGRRHGRKAHFSSWCRFLPRRFRK